MSTPWQDRYGTTRKDRGDRIVNNLGPLPVVGKPAGSNSYLMSALALGTMTPAAILQAMVPPIGPGGAFIPVVIGGVAYRGYVEDGVNANSPVVRLRSQRCTEKYQRWYSNTTYTVTMNNGTPQSCTCPDYVHRHTTHPKCKHMLAVEDKLESEETQDDDNNAGENESTEESEEEEDVPTRRQAGTRRIRTPTRYGTREGYTFNRYRKEGGPRRSTRQRRIPARFLI